MSKVFIVVERIPFEGDTIVEVFAEYDDAAQYMDGLNEETSSDVYDVCEREIY
jgi:hypothetical protein